MGSFSEPSISSTRPIMVAGPMERNSKPRSSGSLDALGGGPCGGPPPRWAHIGIAARQAAARIRHLLWLDIVLPNGVKKYLMVTNVAPGFMPIDRRMLLLRRYGRTARPPRAAVSFPWSTAIFPFTSTKSKPCEYWCGLAEVALASTRAGSNTNRSAAIQIA